jgi:hypothetical protein
LRIKYPQLFKLTLQGKIKPKRLTELIQAIPTVLKSQPKEMGNKQYEVKPLSDLAEGENPGKILSCKVTNILSEKGEVPR